MTAHSLTPRQKQILGLILAGKVNKEIALEMDLAYPSVINLVHRTFKALGIVDDRQLFAKIDQLKQMLAE